MANGQHIGGGFGSGSVSPGPAANDPGVGQNFFARVNPTLQRVEELANVVAAGFARDPKERERRQVILATRRTQRREALDKRLDRAYKNAQGFIKVAKQLNDSGVSKFPPTVQKDFNRTLANLATLIAQSGGNPAEVQTIRGQADALLARAIKRKDFTLSPGEQRLREGDGKPSVIAERPATPKGFGAGITGRSLQFLTDLAPGFEAGTLSPDDERNFQAALTQYRQPEQFADPDTGLIVTRRNDLPDFVKQAIKARRGAVAEQRPPTAQPAPATVGQPQPRPEAGAAADLPTVPEQSKLPDPADYLSAGGRTISDLVLSGNVTGPVPALGRFIARIPGLGVVAPEQTSAPQTLNIMGLRLVRALQTNPRFAVAERADILERVLDIDPKLIDNPQAMVGRMIGIDRALEAFETELLEVTTGQRDRVSKESAQHALDSLQAIRRFRTIFMPPRIETPQGAKEFVRSNPSGTRFMAKDDNGRWAIFEVE